MTVCIRSMSTTNSRKTNIDLHVPLRMSNVHVNREKEHNKVEMDIQARVLSDVEQCSRLCLIQRTSAVVNRCISCRQMDHCMATVVTQHVFIIHELLFFSLSKWYRVHNVNKSMCTALNQCSNHWDTHRNEKKIERERERNPSLVFQ
jgi:hypothetical protein